MNKARRSVIEPCLVIITVLAVGLILSKAAQVAIPFMLAFLLALLLAPVIKAGGRYHIPPVVMVVFVLAALAAICLPFGILLNSKLQGMMQILPIYYNKLVIIGQTLLNEWNIPKDFWTDINWYNTIGRYLTGLTGFTLHWIGNLVMIMIFLVFMLLESPYMGNRLKMAFKGRTGVVVGEIGDKIVSQISKYLRTLAVISFATGLCVWIALMMLGIDFAITWGVLAFFLNFIPTIGSIMASIPPILIALVQFYPNWVPCLLTCVALLAIQVTIGNIMTPKIMGDALDLSPVVILVSLMFWGLIWGFSGALLSVPIAVMIKIICENIPNLHFVAMLMCSAKDGPSAEDSQKNEGADVI